MKKTASIFLALLLLFSFFGCSEQKNELSLSENTQSKAHETTQNAVSVTSPVTESQTVAVTTTTTKETAAEITTEASFAKSTEPQTEKSNEKSNEKKTQTESATSTTVLEQGVLTCFVTIDCRNIQNNLSSLKKEKQSFVPESGFILKAAAVTLPKGATAFDALKKACKENACTDNCKYCRKSGIQLEFSFTPAYQSYYVEGIHQLYEKDCGSLSGWMFNVNGIYPDVSSSVYEVNDRDTITFAYTASMGDDLTE